MLNKKGEMVCASQNKESFCLVIGLFVITLPLLRRSDWFKNAAKLFTAPFKDNLLCFLQTVPLPLDGMINQSRELSQ